MIKRMFQPKISLNGQHQKRSASAWNPKAGLLCLMVFAGVGGTRSPLAQGELLLAYPEQRNVWYDSAPSTPGVATVTSFVGGAVSPDGALISNGASYGLRHAVLGQSFYAQTFFGSRAALGSDISPPSGWDNWPSSPVVIPSERAFYIPETGQLIAADPGTATIEWWDAEQGTTVSRTVLIAPWPEENTATQKIFWTDGDVGDGSGRLAKGPTVDLSVLTSVVTIHHNSMLPASSVWIDEDAHLHAQDHSGYVVLEYSTPAGVFERTEVLEVNAWQPIHSSQVLVGDLLQPANPPTSGTPTLSPFVARGLTPNDEPYTQPGLDYPFVYQYPDLDIYVADIRGQVFALRPTITGSDTAQIELCWREQDADGVIWPYELHAYAARFPNQTEAQWMSVYHTIGANGQPTDAQLLVEPAMAASPTFHYNHEITTSESLKIEYGYVRAEGEIGQILLTYDPGQGKAFLYEFVQVKLYSVNYLTAVPVGARLEPATTVTAMGQPRVVRGAAGTTAFVYQHGVEGPWEGEIFAIRPTVTDVDVEVFWMRTGHYGVTWPYEMHRYTADWPTDRGDYQLLVRGRSAANAGPPVGIPQTLNPTLMPYQTPVGHAEFLNNSLTVQVGALGAENWCLFRYETGTPKGADWIGFQPVRTVFHDESNPEWGFELTPSLAPIGAELRSPNHEGTVPGFIYVPVGAEAGKDRYDPFVYGDTGQIFPVNTGALEVWWYNLSTRVPGGDTQTYQLSWPSMVSRYDCDWPVDLPKNIIADTNGTSPVISADYDDIQIYYQNDPGLPGFNPNDEHATLWQKGGGWVACALRDDLGSSVTSLPYVLIKYTDPDQGGRWDYRAWQVVAEAGNDVFAYAATAGTRLQPPFPLSAMQPCGVTPENPTGSYGVSGPYWADKNGELWARRAGIDHNDTGLVTLRFFYPIQESFYWPDPQDQLAYPAGSCAPWLDRRPGATRGTPQDIDYVINWPESIPKLSVGETLTVRNAGLPEILGACSVDIIYDEATALNPAEQTVQLIDPIRPISVDYAPVTLPADLKTSFLFGLYYFTELPPHLSQRIWFDPAQNKLILKGEINDEDYPPVLLMNVLTERDFQDLLDLSADVTFLEKVTELYSQAQTPIVLGPDENDSEFKALTAATADRAGYVTLAINDAESCNGVVELQIIEIGCPLYQGAIRVLEPDCPLDEKLTLRHSGDFGGMGGAYYFDWRWMADTGGMPPQAAYTDWLTFSPEGGNEGAVDIVIKGSGVHTLQDNWFVVRYRPLFKGQTPCDDVTTDAVDWSPWTAPQLAEGWIKRVLNAMGPFNDKFSEFAFDQPDSTISMIAKAGARWVGDVPLDCGGDIAQMGLIEFYETVLNRGRKLSIDGSPPLADYDPANQALLLAAGRVADLYMLLGNEAYADALDPTIALASDDPQYGPQASSIHSFMNQTESLLDEELKLLRGRDDELMPPVSIYPVYNRLIWNFTNDITGGEVAYALNYNIRDETGNVDGAIDEDDAKRLYPQGHGDAWGHYLKAIKTYYGLLRHPRYAWAPRAEAVLVDGIPVTVDYYDERKFAAAAAAKARTGAEIVNLTYRDAYTEDPAEQWLGYDDENDARAWGLSDWAGRAGQGAYFDWVVANAALPWKDQNPNHRGIQKIDRTTVPEIEEVGAAFDAIQTQIDKADMGLNPLGLAQNVLPFDIDPIALDRFGTSHFEQIYDRAVQALLNTASVFDYAVNSTQKLRSQHDELAQFETMIEEQEADFNGRLIEVFGYPYYEDIGGQGAYATGYDGPDLFHYMYVDPSELLGADLGPTVQFDVEFIEHVVSDTGENEEYELTTDVARTVTYHLSSKGFGLIRPEGWTSRRAKGELQMIRGELVQALGRFNKARQEYENKLADVQSSMAGIEATYDLHADQIDLLTSNKEKKETLNDVILSMTALKYTSQQIANVSEMAMNMAAAALPKSNIFGLANGGDLMSAPRASLYQAGGLIKLVGQAVADAFDVVNLGLENEKESADLELNIDQSELQNVYEIENNQMGELGQLIREAAPLETEIILQAEVIAQISDQYMQALARGIRIWEDRTRFRRQTAAKIAAYRYRDMGFRIFRNDTIQKYRAQFDLAATYVYLAAKAYDYETNLLGRDPMAARGFLEGIVKARAIGPFAGGSPQIIQGAGDPGLSDPLARMKQNWDFSLEGMLGFNNPQKETNRFSLRRELFRISDESPTSDGVWSQTLRAHVVPNILNLPEFKRYARPFDPIEPVEPGIVIPFPTTVNFGRNFFGRPLGGGDSAYDSSNFATKIRSVGVWFSNYNSLSNGMSQTPRGYLIPVGYDVMRSPTDGSGLRRTWKVLDQKIPPPFPISANDFAQPDWLPMYDALTGEFAAIRKYSSFRAYHDSGVFNPDEMVRDSRLIGRSVWNTRWVLIIPAGTLHSDRQLGLNLFIDGPDGASGAPGVTDIKLFFETYAYSGN